MGMALMVGAQSGSLGLASGDEYSLVGFSNDSPTEANCQVSCTEGATFENFRTAVRAGNSGTATFQWRTNGANGAQVVAIVGTAAGEDAVNTDALSAGDLFNIAYTDTGTASTVTWSAVNVTFASGHGSFHGAAAFPANVHDVGAATRFIALGGNLPNDGQATEANVQWKNRIYTSWEALQVRVTANARVNNSDFTNEINGTTGAALCRFTSGVTGLIVDASVGDALASGDLVCVGLTLDTGVQDLDVTFVVATLKSTNNGCEIFVYNQGGVARAASSTANFVQFGGFTDLTEALTDAQARVKVGFAGTAKNLRIYLSANTYTGDGTLKLYKNGSAVLTCTITAAGGAGWYENTSDTVDFDDNDEFSFEFDEGTSGSITIHGFGVTLAPQTTVAVPGPQGLDNQFVAFHDGTIDPTMHKISNGIACNDEWRIAA